MDEWLKHALAILGIAGFCGVWIWLQLSTKKLCSGSCGACTGGGHCSTGSSDQDAEG